MRSVSLIAIVVAVAHLVSAGPAPASNAELISQIEAMQEQLVSMQQMISGEKKEARQDLDSSRFLSAIPQKRMVAWQPMKRSEVDRETLFRAIEARLMEVLAAGERLGISSQELLEHIREKNRVM